MPYSTLIDAATLHTHLDDPDWVVVDCRFNLKDTEAGWRAYREGHIPGARYAHLDRDLSSPVTPDSGRHPLPDPDQFAATLGAWGIGDQTQVVAYDAGPGSVAARLWWMLCWLGSTNCAVLDGGLAAWRLAGYRLDDAIPEPASRVFTARADHQRWVDSAGLAAATGTQLLVLDARTGERYRGEAEPIDTEAGHIPASLSAPLEENLQGGQFRDPDALRRRFVDLIGERDPHTVVHSCGSGVSACHNLLAMELAGLTGSKLYPGSWSEWIRDPDRPRVSGER